MFFLQLTSLTEGCECQLARLAEVIAERDSLLNKLNAESQKEEQLLLTVSRLESVSFQLYVIAFIDID